MTKQVRGIHVEKYSKVNFWRLSPAPMERSAYDGYFEHTL